MDDTRKLISIIVPVFNEQGNIFPLYTAVSDIFETIKDKYEVEFIFTDNHSDDKKNDELLLLAERHSNVKAYKFSRNFGFQNSILTGFRKAKGDAIVQIDCDLQDPPELILDFIRLWETGYKVVYGVRDQRQESIFLKMSRKAFYKLISKLSTHDLPEGAGDFRLVDAEIAGIVRGYTDAKPYLRGFIASLGFLQIGIVYDRTVRTVGKSKFNLSHLFGLAFDGIIGYSETPLRLASVFAGISFLLFFFAIGMYAFLRIFYGPTIWPPGVASLIILVLFSMACNALFFGLLGEYISRIFLQVRDRPQVIIETSTEDNENKDV